MENKISFTLTDEEKTQVNDAIKVLEDILEPKLETLIPDDKRDLPKMGDKTVSFVEKSLGYGQTYPEFVPGFVDINEAQIDLDSVKTLRQFLTPLSRITNEIDDTMVLAGSEAYASSRVIYKVLKNAAAMGQPGAAEAVEELKKRFPGTRKKETPAEE
ncbi:hypothetical protein DF185_16050 [Marinifilum breve]|uniref:Uncharacterized protein n=1 Tax=Marinifilum breve TaxID=2184082 RepID=A0A2V3ZUZ6_9BACT|nr:hypothetical protein [Marinifilum breve]PXX98886.1 hypothetical protein DF185_16050 [Marinifilum breve]